MLPTFADPKTDVVFKRIFGDEGRKPLLIALLNDLLELEGPRRIRDVEHLSSEQRVAVPAVKLSIVDVKCTTAQGRRFVVEMQVLPVEGFEKRVVYNAAKAYVMQLRSADEYFKLSHVVAVTICDFVLWPKKTKAGDFKVPMLSRWRMQEQHGGHKGLPQIQHAFLELPKYPAGKAPESLVDKWAYFFREAKWLTEVPPALSGPPFLEALEVARAATFTPGERESYERAKMAEQDERGALAYAHREGREEGRREAVAAAILAILSARGVAVSDRERTQIETCGDIATLDRWIVRAAVVSSADEVFGAPSEAS